MFSFFKKKQAPAEENKPFVVKAYLSGKVVPIEEVKDEVFSSKALGEMRTPRLLLPRLVLLFLTDKPLQRMAYSLLQEPVFS